MHSSRVNTLGIGETIWVKIKTVVGIEVHPDMVCFLYLLSSMMAHRRMAIRAPVLRPGELLRASALHSSMLPSRSQVHTLTVRVPVLLCMG